MNSFQRSTTNIAAWNLEGFDGIPDERIEKQIQGLSMLDAEVVALVEINPIEVLDKLKYEYTIVTEISCNKASITDLSKYEYLKKLLITLDSLETLKTTSFKPGDEVWFFNDKPYKDKIRYIKDYGATVNIGT